MPNLNMTMTLQEILDAFAPAWRLANRTDEGGAFTRPDYRQALAEVWSDIVVAASMKEDGPHTVGILNVAMTRNGPPQ